MTSTDLPWFRCFPSKWLGALSSLRPDVGYIYVIVCLRIYERDDAIPDDALMLARRAGFNEPHVRKMLDQLVALKKLFRDERGYLDNQFSANERKERRDKILSSKKLHRLAASKRWEKAKQNQGKIDAYAMQNDAHKHIDSDSEKKERGMNECGAVAPSAPRVSSDGDHDRALSPNDLISDDKLLVIRAGDISQWQTSYRHINVLNMCKLGMRIHAGYNNAGRRLKEIEKLLLDKDAEAGERKRARDLKTRREEQREAKKNLGLPKWAPKAII